MVVFGHSHGAFGLPHEWTGVFPSYHGVSFFFVLSGFILTVVYPQLKSIKESGQFLLARFARVWPLHAFTFFVLFLTVDWVPKFVSTPQGVRVAALNLSLLQAWSPYTFYNMSFNAVSWSISVEAFFYLAFVGLIQLRDRHWHLLPLIGLIPAVGLISLTQWLELPTLVSDYHTASLDSVLYVNPLARLFEFTLGMSAAVLFERLSPNVPKGLLIGTGLELVAVALFGLSLTLNIEFFERGYLSHVLPISLRFWLERSGAAPLFAIIIIIFAAQRGAFSSVLSQRFYVVAGEISFAIYLLHQIIQTFILKNSAMPHSMAFALFIFFTVWISYLAWRYVESPARSAILSSSKSDGRSAIVRTVGSVIAWFDSRRKCQGGANIDEVFLTSPNPSASHNLLEKVDDRDIDDVGIASRKFTPWRRTL
jgi:peptidoglycan/LPS O-acetylase OafA/YrhL